jgi:hypothetical protein
VTFEFLTELAANYQFQLMAVFENEPYFIRAEDRKWFGW